MLTTEANAGVTACSKPVDQPCTGAQCMAWRWFDPAEVVGMSAIEGTPPDDTHAWTMVREDKNRKTWVWKRTLSAGERRGFCGLAGAPKEG